jgi:hypothetical protein
MEFKGEREERERQIIENGRIGLIITKKFGETNGLF